MLDVKFLIKYVALILTVWLTFGMPLGSQLSAAKLFGRSAPCNMPRLTFALGVMAKECVCHMLVVL